MLRRFLERLRGIPPAPDDLAVGTTRPGDFAEEPEVVQERGEGPVEPNPHEEESERP
jgi:hypothetical protein